MLSDLFQFYLKLNEVQTTDKLIWHFGQNKVDLLILDEGQKMFGDGKGFAANKFANWLLTFENARVFKTVVAGGPELLDLIDHHPTLRDRKDSLVSLRPLSHRTNAARTAFQKFLGQFDEQMPFLSTPLTDSKMQDALFYATRGRPGTLAKLMEKAAQFAFTRKKNADPAHLTKTDLAEAFAFMMAEETRMLVNPFAHVGPLPSIPLSLEEEEVTGIAEDQQSMPKKQRGARIARKP